MAICWASTLLVALLVMLAVVLVGAAKAGDPAHLTVRLAIFLGIGTLAIWLAQMLTRAACGGAG
jgi:hypothetical protein